jgi:hypothetical protein
MQDNFKNVLASMDEAIEKLEGISKKMRVQAEKLSAISGNLQEISKMRKLTAPPPVFPDDIPILPEQSQLP